MNSEVIYGDVSPNVIDGSSIWLTSMTEVLSKIFDTVHLQVKQPIKNNLLSGTISKLSNVQIHEPVEDDLTPESAAIYVERLIQEYSPSAVVCRGIDACNAFCLRNLIAPILWSYVTELPFPPDRISPNNKNRLNRISARSRRMFAQTDAARSYLESIAPSSAGKTILLPPMVPTIAYRQEDKVRNAQDKLSIIYSGKLARAWKTLEMLELPAELKKLDIDAELVVVGAKFNKDRAQPGWLSTMQKAIQDASNDENSGVRWIGSVSREESLRLISQSDLGIGWRTSELDGGLEISTKALEYAATNTPPIINRTSAHEELFGQEYPFYVSSKTTVSQLAALIASQREQINKQSSVLKELSSAFSMDAAVNRLQLAFSHAGCFKSEAYQANISPDKKCTRVLIVSHDLKFMGELMDHLTRSPDFEIRIDKWSSLHNHDEEKSNELLAWADTIFCEWAGPSLEWYSNRVNENQKLIARLHRFELDGPWLPSVVWPNVSKMIFVSELYRRMALERLPIVHSATEVIPNSVDCLDFDRPKTANAQYTLGFVGMVPIHKRPDRAVLLLQKLLERDDRYTLRFKGRLPWEYPYEWKNPVQKQLYLEFFNNIAQDKELRKHIIFDGFGADVASWQRNIGFTLSPSEVESFHMAPAEGMAARSVPIFWNREGVDEIFGEQFLLGSLDDAVELILQCRDPDVFAQKGQEARESVLRWDPSNLFPQWESTLSIQNSL